MPGGQYIPDDKAGAAAGIILSMQSRSEETNMTITEEVREAIRKTCLEERGGALKLARKAGFTPAQINRYHSGKTKTMSEACWTRLFPHVKSHLPDGFTCKILVDGIPETRIVRRPDGDRIVWQQINGEYSRLFGSNLPTREKIVSHLTGKIRNFGNDMALLYFLLDFDRIMEDISSRSMPAFPPVPGKHV